jgi:rsbT co-antagonist protein RsbR
MNNEKARIEAILHVMARATQQEFEHRVEVSGAEDEFTEAEIGINVLLEDLMRSKLQYEDSLRELQSKKQEIAERASLSLRELSTPIISVWDGVLALPVVGTVDTERSSEMMDTLLARVIAEQASHVIIDITGVSVLDTRTADHFMRMAQAVQLLGSNCFITGISPAIAQTMTQLDIKTDNVRTLRRLSDALKLSFQERGIQS